MRIFKKQSKRTSVELHLHLPIHKHGSGAVNTLGLTFSTYINFHWMSGEEGKLYQLDVVILGLGFSVSARWLKKGLEFHGKAVG